ncbi:MAG: cyclic nucleotide-binding domain-containing protein [Rhodobacteraceae bacterium]|nr:cyclic nucleotide-binding domain-containing protein [Paracoccaceae bacterium]
MSSRTKSAPAADAAARANQILLRKAIPAGQKIFFEGAEADRAFIIQSGEVDICARGAYGELKVLTTLQKGQVFGEMALMMNAPRSATAVAKTACELTIVHKSHLEEKMQSIDPLIRRWVESLAKRIVMLTQKVS